MFMVAQFATFFAALLRSSKSRYERRHNKSPFLEDGKEGPDKSLENVHCLTNSGVSVMSRKKTGLSRKAQSGA